MVNSKDNTTTFMADQSSRNLNEQHIEDESCTAVDDDSLSLGQETEKFQNIILNNSNCNNDEISIESIFVNLKEALVTLSNVSENTRVNIDSLSIDPTESMKDQLSIVQKLSQLILELSHGVACKMDFLGHNYRFLQGVHDHSSDKNNKLLDNLEQMKIELKEMRQESNNLKEKHNNYIKTTNENMDQQIQQKQEILDAHSIIDKQKSELASCQTVIQYLMNAKNINLS